MELSEQTAYTAGSAHGYTIVLDSHGDMEEGESAYKETVLPFAGSNYKPPKENPPEKLRKMRSLYTYGPESPVSRAESFRRQAVFMADYEDDFPWTGDLVCYFPTYQDLTTKQLRGYFSWRTQVRRGIFQPIAASAAYIYLYELLNGVGADSPADILEKLRVFEAGYIGAGFGDGRMRDNLRRWMLEYCILKGLPADLAREIAGPKMTARDDAISVLEAPDTRTDEEVFAALCFFGRKTFAASPVIRNDPARGRHLFAEAWRAVCAAENEKLFALCFGEKKTRRWHPLQNAVYCEERNSEDREYVFSACRTYFRTNGVWQVRAYEKLSYNRLRMQGFLSEADARLRRYLKTGRYLKENPAGAWAVPFIEAVIEADRQRFLEEARPKIIIDLTGLQKIREDAVTTRDSLLTEEERGEMQEAERIVTKPAPGEAAVPRPEETASVPEAQIADAQTDLPLDALQIRVLRSLLAGKDAAGLLKEEHVMPTIAADAINEALFEAIGDTVVLCDGDTLGLADDYMEELTALLGGI